jgi:hypothetical protein
MLIQTISGKYNNKGMECMCLAFCFDKETRAAPAGSGYHVGVLNTSARKPAKCACQTDARIVV